MDPIPLTLVPSDVEESLRSTLNWLPAQVVDDAVRRCGNEIARARLHLEFTAVMRAINERRLPDAKKKLDAIHALPGMQDHPEIVRLSTLVAFLFDEAATKGTT